MNLDPDDIEAVAARVAELLRDEPPATERLVDAATLARALGVERGWVYARARQLGAVRLGPGPRARLRFDAQRAAAAVRGIGALDTPPPDRPRPLRRGRPRTQTAPAGVRLIQGRGGR